MPLSLLEGTLGGIGLFLLGMRILTDGIRKVADDRIRGVVSAITSNRFSAMLFGVLLSYSLNSVNAAVIFSIGLLNGGVLNPFQSLSVLGGVVLGAALTLHVPGVPYSLVATPLLFVGVILKFFARRRRLANAGDLLLGAGLLFLGLTLLEGSFRPYESHPFYNIFNGIFFNNPALATMFGSMISCFVQSSTSLTGIIASLMSNYPVSSEIASVMMLGGYIGISLIGLLVSLGGVSVSRFVALTFFLVNILVVFTLVAVFHFVFDMDLFWKLAVSLSGGRPYSSLAWIYSCSGLITALTVMAFASPAARLIGVFAEQMGNGSVSQPCAGYLDRRILNTPMLAIEQAKKEIVRMISVTAFMFGDTKELLFDYDARRAETIRQHEQVLDSLNHEITSFLLSLANSSSQPDILNSIPELLQTVTELEHIGDRCEGVLACIVSRKEVGILFSDDAMADLKLLTDKVGQCIMLVESCFRDGICLEKPEFRQIKSETRGLFDEVKQRHYDRMSSGECNSRAAIIFNDISIGFARISELCWNILAVLGRRQ